MKNTVANRGKAFEERISAQFSEIETCNIVRLYDPTYGGAGISNPCDFIVYDYPIIIYLECKCFNGNSFSFKRLSQWSKLMKLARKQGVVAGVLFWFISHDKTVFVSIEELQRLKEMGEKGLNINKLDLCHYVEMTGNKKHVYFDYDIRLFLGKLKKEIIING